MVRCFFSGKYVRRMRYSPLALTGAIFFQGMSMMDPSRAARGLTLFFSEEGAQLVGHFPNIFLTKPHGFAIALDHVVFFSPCWVELLEIDPAVGTAALFASQRAQGHRLGNRQHRFQIQRQVPSRII